MKPVAAFVFCYISVGLLVGIITAADGSTPSLFKCVDWECEEWISKGRTLLMYMGRTDNHLSFKKNQEILIIGKPVDESSPDWMGKIGDKIGLVPRDYVREDKMSKNPTKFTVGLHEISAWSRNEEKAEQETEKDKKEADVDGADENDEDVNEVGVEDMGEDDENEEMDEIGDGEENDDDVKKVGNSGNIDDSLLTSPEAPTSEQSTETVVPESPQSLDIISSSTFFTTEENLQTQVVPPIPDKPVQESDSRFEVGSGPGTQNSAEPDVASPEEIKINEIPSDPVLELDSLQASVDTVLQAPTTTVEYIDKMLNTDEQNTDIDPTPRIAESDVLYSFSSIPNAVLGEGMTSQSEIYPTKVENPSEVETDIVAQVEENTRADGEDSKEEEKPEANSDEFNVSTLEEKAEDKADSLVGLLSVEPEKNLDNDEYSDVAISEMETAEVKKVPIMGIEIATSSPQKIDVKPTSETEAEANAEDSNVLTVGVETVTLEPDTVPEMMKMEITTYSPSKIDVGADKDVESARKSEEEPRISKEFVKIREDYQEVPIVFSASTDEESSTLSANSQQTDTSASPSEIPSKEVPSLDETKTESELPVKNESSNQNNKIPQLNIEESFQSSLNVTKEVVTITSESSSSDLHIEEAEVGNERPGNELLAGFEQSMLLPDAKLENDKQEPAEASESSEIQDISSVQSDSLITESSLSVEELSPPRAEEAEDETIPYVASVETQTIETPTEDVPTPSPPTVDVPTPSPPTEDIPTPPLTDEIHANDVPQEAVEDHHLPHNHNAQDAHDDDHHHHHHHHHRHNLFKDTNDAETSSIIIVIKHLSSTLLSFLPEPLQDTILDVDDALVLTGIIALTLISICVPYFLIEAHMSLRPLKKKVVELNKSLWKVSAAYETQQEEFEIFKQKAIAHDEFKKRAEQSENDLVVLKKLETIHREQIIALKNKLKSQMKEAVDIRALIEKTLEAKKVVADECEKYRAAYESTKEALNSARDELNSIQTKAKSSALLLNVSGKNVDVLNSKIAMLEQETEEMKSQLEAENQRRKNIEKEKHEVEQSKATVEKELRDFKNVCHQYETTVCGLNDEISKLESELATIKETLGEDSPLLEMAEIQAKTAFAEKQTESLRTRLNGLIADNENMSSKVKELTKALEEAHGESEKRHNRLQVLEKYFKEREEEYIKTIEQLQLKESVRDKGKDELFKIIEEKDNVCKDLDDRLEALKEEFEETNRQHRSEIRTLEAKVHENWLSLCQAERKAQDARKEAQQLRQQLTALSKEKDDEDGDGLNGEVPMFPVLPDELIPLPLFDESQYFDIGGDFVPPPPLPEGGEMEPHRPPPLGGRLSPSFSDFGDEDNILSPIAPGRRDEDCTDGSSGSNSPRRSPPLRGGWVNVPHNHEGQEMESIRRLSRATSSPIQRGANL